MIRGICSLQLGLCEAMGSILVIEDDPKILELVSYLLEAFGHQVVTATDGEAGLALAYSHKVDLILCDIQMPKLDGYEVAFNLKQNPILCKIPLVAMTAFAMVVDQERILNAGFDSVITKPISAKSFIATIAGLIAA